jgi:hypothetical protein
MAMFLARRLLLLIPVFFAVSLIIFMIVRFVPGDPIDNLIQIGSTEEQKAALIASYGLDKPLPVQYGIWFLKVIQGDLGEAMILRRPVADLIALNLPHSLALGSLALVFSTVVGIAAGALTPKAAVMVLEVGQRAPEHQLGELRIAHLVGVGEVVARGRREAESGDGPRLEPQPVADVIEAQRMGELDKEHRAEVAEHGIGPGFDIDTRLPGCTLDDVTRNELEHLPENVDMVTCWLGGVSGCWF